MKRLIPIFSMLVILIASSACSHNERVAPVSAPATEALGSETAEANGLVKQLLINPSGKVDGFIMSDGTRVSCPPHMSAEVVRTIAANDRVNVVGVRENDRVIRAHKITNTSTNQYVSVAEQTPPASEPANHPMPKRKDIRPMARTAGMKPLKAQGKIQSQLFGREGEVNGVVLSDSSVVRFSPEVLGKTKAKFEVGQGLKASGYGTKNSYGKALEATSISNY